MPGTVAVGRGRDLAADEAKSTDKKKDFSTNSVRYGVEPTQDFYSCFVPPQTAAEGAEHLVGTEPAVPEARAVPR